MLQSHSKFHERLVVGLLFVFMVINFADKAVLGFVAVPMMKEMGLTPAQFGMVASSFFLLYSVSGIAFGFLANRFKTKWILLILALLWAATQFPIIWWPSLGVLVVCRVLLGIGEGPAYPVAIHAVYKWFPNDRRNLPTAFISQGAPVGVVVTAPIMGYLIAQYGWRAAFVALGVAGLAWTVVWIFFGAEGKYGDAPAATRQAAPTEVAAAPVPYWALLTDRSVLGTIIASFAAYWILAVGLTWLPPYLQHGLGYSTVNTGWLVAVIVASNIPLQIGGSWLSQYLLERGVASRIARGWVMSGLIAIGGLSILIAMTVDGGLVMKIVFLAIGCALPNIAFCIGPAIIGEITPSAQRGAILAINSSLATIAGLLAPMVTGWILQNAATPGIGYGHSYLVSAVILMVGGGIALLMIHPGASRDRLIKVQHAGSPAARATLRKQG